MQIRQIPCAVALLAVIAVMVTVNWLGRSAEPHTRYFEKSGEWTISPANGTCVADLAREAFRLRMVPDSNGSDTDIFLGDARQSLVAGREYGLRLIDRKVGTLPMRAIAAALPGTDDAILAWVIPRSRLAAMAASSRIEFDQWDAAIDLSLAPAQASLDRCAAFLARATPAQIEALPTAKSDARQRLQADLADRPAMSAIVRLIGVTLLTGLVTFLIGGVIGARMRRPLSIALPIMLACALILALQNVEYWRDPQLGLKLGIHVAAALLIFGAVLVWRRQHAVQPSRGR